MHYTEGKKFERDPERMEALSLLVEGWSGVDLYGALNVIAARMQETMWPQFEEAEEELTDERSVGVTGIAHRLTCPHCGDMVDKVEEIEWSVCVTDGEVYDQSRVGFAGEGPSDPGHEGLAYRCPTCHGIADIPAEMEVVYG